MADAGVIIKADLKEEDLTRKIDKLVQDVDNKFKDMADKVDASIQKVATSLGNFKTTAQTNVQEIKDAFQQLGTTFDQFAKAMEKAAAAASGMGRGGVGGSGGSGGSGGGTPPTGASDTIAALKEEIRLQQQFIDGLKQESEELQKAVDKLRQKEASLKRQLTDSSKLRQINANKDFGTINSMSTTTYDKAYDKASRLRLMLARLEDEARRMGVAKYDFLPESMWNRIQKAIDVTEQKMERLQRTAQKPIIPTNFNDVMNMPTTTLNEIRTKMQAIKDLRGKTPIDSGDINKLNLEYAKLAKMQDKILGKNTELIKSNNALGRAFNYVKNRLAFALSIGAITQFTRQLYEIRGQYELLERSLGVLVNSFSKGSRIFAELNAMAIQSPYTLIELGTAAKQLTAYNFEANEVVNTTKRLADIASALGVPIERLVYNLGQIRAQTVLTARDARDFANAGLAIVPELAKYYTELEGKVVSTADVFDRMKKKAVSYSDVMAVLNKVTDEGGKFFDFQAKQAGTLKVQMANLNLAWNNMLNSIGKSNQAALTAPISALKAIFKSWNSIANVLKSIALAYGSVKLLQISYAMSTATASKATALATATNWKFVNSLVGIRNGLAQLATSPTTWLMIFATLIYGVAAAYDDAQQALHEFNKSVRESAKENVENLTSFLKEYSEVRDKVNNGNLDEKEASKAWEAIKEQIELTSNASEHFISNLTTIENINQRIQSGFAYIDIIKSVNAALQNIDDETIKINNRQSDWTDVLGVGAVETSYDGLARNVKRYTEYLADAREEMEETGKKMNEFPNRVSRSLASLKVNLDETTKSMHEFAKEKDWLANPEAITEMYGNIGNKIIQEGLEDFDWQPSDVFNFQLEWEEYRSKASKEALAQRVANEEIAYRTAEDEKTAITLKAIYERDKAQLDAWEQNNGKGRILWADFCKWMEEEHDSEVRTMYNKMTDNGKKTLDYSSKEWIAWVNEMADKYAREHKISHDEAFNYLKDWVRRANLWDIFIKLTISTGDGKSLYDELTEYDKAADEAYNKQKRLRERINDLDDEIDKGKGKKHNSFSSWIERQEKVVGLLNERSKALKEEKEAVEDLEEAESKGGKSKSKEADAKKKEAAANKANAASRRAAAKAQRQAETELQKAFKDELQILDKTQKAYSDLSKAGMSRQDALALSTKGYEKSIQHINDVFKKWGIQAFDVSKYAGVSNPREILNMLESQLNTVIAKAKPEEIKELEVKIKEIRLEAEKFDMKKITDGLNNELGKIKEEYELAVELDANPELGDMFADMFGIDIDELPHTFGEAYDRANKVAIEKLKKLEKEVQGFDLMSTDLTKFAEKQGIEPDSNLIQELMKDQKTWRDIYKKNLVETEKYLDDYVKKYGNMSDKIAEIEADRLHKIKQLNEAYYTEQMRKMPEYKAKLDAINKGAEKEKGGVRFDEFKNSRLYVAMFENLQYVSTATLKTIHQKLNELKSEMGTLTPEQLKQVVQQFEKIDNELRRRSPFAGLIKNYHDYVKATGKAGKQAEKDLIVAQENYDKQMQVVTALKEQLEQKKAQTPQDRMGLILLQGQIVVENLKLEKLKEELEKAIELNEQYNFMKKVFGEQWQSLGKLAQSIATNFKSLGELRDYLKDAGVDFGDMFDGVVDSLQGVSDGINQMVSSASSGDIFGTITGTIKTVFGIGDAIASIFGDGAARTRRINREIEKSQEQVRKLNMAYKDLERAVDKAMGSQETAAQRALIANKKLEKAELERQLRLEKSKRSKDRDEDAIKKYEEQIQELTHQIEDLGDSIVENLLGSNIKSAAEDFVDTWVSAWKEGENTLDAVEGKMDDITKNLIKKAIASKIVGTLLQPFYDAVDKAASEQSESGVELSLNELKQLSDMANSIGISINDALLALFTNLENMGIIDKGAGSAELSALQQGIQGITEDTAGALEAYMNSVSQQVYLHSDLLTQIRDILINFGGDVTIATNAQILLQLQQSFQVQMTIQNVLTGVLNASGLAFRVELAN